MSGSDDCRGGFDVAKVSGATADDLTTTSTMSGTTAVEASFDAAKVSGTTADATSVSGATVEEAAKVSGTTADGLAKASTMSGATVVEAADNMAYRSALSGVDGCRTAGNVISHNPAEGPILYMLK